MSHIRDRLTWMQKDLNRLRHRRVLREKELERLQNHLGAMQMSDDDDQIQEETVKQREGELAETLLGLNNELYYQETLQHMLECRRLNMLALKKPVNRLKKELAKAKWDIEAVKMHNRRAHTASTFFHKSIEDYEDVMKHTKEMQTKVVEQDIDVLKNRQRLEILLQKEQDMHKEATKQAQTAKRLKLMESDLERLQGNFHTDEEVIVDEIKQIENHVVNEERKFKKIQSVTNISSIADMEPYWRYLVENKERLEKAVQQAQIQIEELNQERVIAEQELHSLTLETEERKRLNPRELEEREDGVKSKLRFLEEGETAHNHLKALIAAATNSVSRIAFQLADRPENVDIGPDSLVENLTFCSIKLEQMLASLLKRNVMYLEESVNSDIQVKAPPEYMHINFETFARKDSEDKDAGTVQEQDELDSLRKDRRQVRAEKAQVLKELRALNPPDSDSDSPSPEKPRRSRQQS